MQEETKLLSAVIGDVYDAALDPDAWPRALASISACTHSAACTINYHDISKGTALLAHEHGTDPHFSRLYVERYADKNPLVAAIMTEAVGDPKRVRDLVPSQAFEASQLYLEWCAPQRYDDLLGACIYREGVRVGALAVVRRVEDGRYSDDDVDLFATIGAHVHRSLSIGDHLALRRADASMFGSIVDRLATAVLLIDHAGWVLYRNEAADQLMSSQRLGRIVNQKLSLTGVDLQELVASVARRRFFETAISGGSAERGIKLAAIAMSAGPPTRSNPIAIFLTGLPGSAKPSESFLKTAYELTPAEIRVAFGLLAGLAPADIAIASGLSIATVRSQIASVREKVGAGTTSDLIRLLSAASAPIVSS
jgi:DNA-binding CsgD family transcriptional regulator/PAS domain-containing protein